MKIEKLKVESKKLDLNLKFYFLLKYLVKAKLTKNQSYGLLEQISLDFSSKENSMISEVKGLSGIRRFIDKSISGNSKRDAMELLFEQVETDADVEMFLFSLKLYLIKDALLEESKIGALLNIEKLKDLDPLSISYDKISVQRPYYTRVNGTLISLLFFSQLENKEANFISQDAQKFLEKLSESAVKLKNKGLEPNQIFMLMFSESINQSIISDSGSNYEDRILTVLKSIGIPEDKITKVHDKKDASTEFDFLFKIGSRSYGIGAKRTLRERYKQFIKTSKRSRKDVMIEITLGLDLNEEKAKTIRSYGVYLFVADEIYESRKFLKNLDNVYSVKNLNIKTLESLKSLKLL